MSHASEFATAWCAGSGGVLEDEEGWVLGPTPPSHRSRGRQQLFASAGISPPQCAPVQEQSDKNPAEDCQVLQAGGASEGRPQLPQASISVSGAAGHAHVLHLLAVAPSHSKEAHRAPSPDATVNGNGFAADTGAALAAPFSLLTPHKPGEAHMEGLSIWC